MLLGVIFVIIASICFSVTPLLLKIALNAGMNTASVLLITNIAGTIIMFVIVKVKKMSLKLSKKEFLHMFLFGFLGYELTTLVLTASYNYIPVGICTILHFLYPVMVTIIMAVLFGEKLNFMKVAAIICSLCGILCIVNISGGSSGTDMIKGIALALLSSITYASYVVGNDKSSFSKVHISVILLYFFIFAGIGFATYLFATNSYTHPSDNRIYILIPMTQVLSIIGLSTLALGVRKIGASYAAIINMLEPAINMILSSIIFKHEITPLTIIGCLLIMGSILMIFLRAKPEKKSDTNSNKSANKSIKSQKILEHY